NVNFFCHAPPVTNPEREARWRAALAPYYAEYGIDPNAIPAGPSRAPFSAEAADILDEFRPAVISFHFGLPTPELLDRVKAFGAQVGTAYLLCAEATTSAVHRTALKSEAARHTALTNLFTGRPARGIVNRIMRELGPVSDAAPTFPSAAAAIAPLRSKAEARGLGDFSPLWSGQNP